MPEITIAGTVSRITSRATKRDPVPILVVDTTEEPDHPELTAVEFFGKSAGRLEEADVSVGDEVSVRCRVSSREWQGKYYTQVSGWKIEIVNRAAAEKPAGKLEEKPAEPKEDLPF